MMDALRSAWCAVSRKSSRQHPRAGAGSTPALRPPVREPRILRLWEHQSWGDHIEWFPAPTQIVGHLECRPQAGDILLARYKSGRIGRHEIVAVKYCADPPDMFFATVEFRGYESTPERTE